MNPKKLVRKVVPKKGIRLAEETYRKGRIYALQAKYGFPARGMRVIGVTGTDGKTTTCNYINEMLKSAGFKTAMFTTALIEMAGDSQPNLTHRTVPLTADLMQFFKTAKAKKVDFVVLEVSSQALHQHKMLGIPFEVAVMTNLTQEHLDYHFSMYAYAAAKARLLELPGVGEKVADCVLLFGAGRLEAFPVDTWILKALERRYGLTGWKPAQIAHFGRTHFGPLAGLAQQYLFSWERKFGSR